MEWLDYLRFLLALAFVLGLIGVVAWLARRFRLVGVTGAAPAERRLRVVEVLPLDPRRKLVLVRRDEVEHLLLLGQDGNLVLDGPVRAGRGPSGARAAAGEPE